MEVSQSKSTLCNCTMRLSRSPSNRLQFMIVYFLSFFLFVLCHTQRRYTTLRYYCIAEEDFKLWIRSTTRGDYKKKTLLKPKTETKHILRLFNSSQTNSRLETTTYSCMYLHYPIRNVRVIWMQVRFIYGQTKRSHYCTDVLILPDIIIHGICEQCRQHHNSIITKRRTIIFKRHILHHNLVILNIVHWLVFCPVLC